MYIIKIIWQELLPKLTKVIIDVVVAGKAHRKQKN